MVKILVGAWRWMAKHWAVTTSIVLLIAVGITSALCWKFFGDPYGKISVYVTIEGMGEGNDMENRKLPASENDTVYDVFSMKYPETYRDFKEPVIVNNAFLDFLGVRASSSKEFYVTVDGVYESNLTQAYLRDGSIIEIEYK